MNVFGGRPAGEGENLRQAVVVWAHIVKGCRQPCVYRTPLEKYSDKKGNVKPLSKKEVYGL